MYCLNMSHTDSWESWNRSEFGGVLPEHSANKSLGGRFSDGASGYWCRTILLLCFGKGRLSRFQKVKRPHKLQTCLEERESGIGSGDVPSWHVSIITFKERIWKGLDGILPNHVHGKGGGA